MTEAVRRTGGEVSLMERRTIRAPLERVFAAWTEPTHLRVWWGPRGVTCTGAEVDLRVGGRYRLGNRLEDGREVWITGEFLEVRAPRKLVYTWVLDDAGVADEHTRVTVRFEPHADGTEVIVVHDLIRSEALHQRTQRGWAGCLEKLRAYMAGDGK